MLPQLAPPVVILHHCLSPGVSAFPLFLSPSPFLALFGLIAVGCLPNTDRRGIGPLQQRVCPTAPLLPLADPG